MAKSVHTHFFPVLDLMINDAIEETAAQGEHISCHKGCAHCCHLLIEITWEEALFMVDWIAQLPACQKQDFIMRIQRNAAMARDFFTTQTGASAYAQPVEGDVDLADEIYDAYFYEEKRPCPMLDQDGVCGAYSVRPSPCRLHVVTSPAKYCSADKAFIDAEVETPAAMETVTEEAGTILNRIERDPRWGHFGIVLEAALIESGLIETTRPQAVEIVS